MAEAGSSLLLDALAPAGAAVASPPAGLTLSPGPVGEARPMALAPADLPPTEGPVATTPAVGQTPGAATFGASAGLALGLALALTAGLWQHRAPRALPDPPPPPPLPALQPWPETTAAAPAAAPVVPASAAVPIDPAPLTPQRPAAGPAMPARLRITRTADHAPGALALAHLAYQRGDLAAARLAYRAALKREPAHPDALLGLAAIAERKGENSAARTGYAEVLARDPGQWAARASLLGLAASASPIAAPPFEDAPSPRNAEEDARRLDALGRAAAAAGRWGQARAYFAAATDAVPESADYAYALAVSLDRLGLHAAARAGYGRALELGLRAPAGFARDAARARLAALAAQDGR